jgi:hypothetical protein
MSTQITTAFVEQYRNNVELLVQQRGSVLRDFVNTDNAVVGKTKFTEQIGSTEAQKKVSRHSDSPLVNTPHARRAYSLEDYEWGDLIDKNDKVRMLIDPTSTYAQAAAFAMGRAMDDVIITAATGTAKTGVSGGTDTTLPSSQVVASNAIDNDSDAAHGLSPQKLRSALTIFHENNVPEDEEKFLVVSPKAIQSLLTHKEVVSSDFNTVRALVNGEVDTYMGFRFIISNRLAIDSSSIRDCFAYTRSGLELGIGQDVMARIEERPDKSFSTYVYYCMTIGATRLEEEKVVKIEVDESALADGKAATV